MKIHLLLLFSCAVQIIPGNGHLRQSMQNDEMVKWTTSLNNGNRILLQSHRSLQDEAPTSPSGAPSNSSAPTDQPNPFNTGCEPGWEQKLIEFNRTRQEVWADPICYSYVLVPSCFCPPEYTRPVLIEVYNDTVMHMEYVDDPTATVLGAERLLTMNGLYEKLYKTCFEGCPNVGAHLCWIEYDSVNGTIKNIYIDQSRMIMDEEIRYSIFNFSLC